MLVSPQTVCIDKVLYHVRDFHSFLYAVSNPVEDKIPVSGDDKMYITVCNSGDGNDHSVDSDLGSLRDDNDKEGQQLTMWPSQSADEPALPFAQLAEAVEYTDCFSAEG